MLENMRKKRVLFPGGGGFVRSHLCTRLIENYQNIHCSDNLYSNEQENMTHFVSSTYSEFVRHDVTFPFNAKVDEIYNPAYPTSPIHFRRDPILTTKTRIHGTINVLGLAKRPSGKFLEASIGGVYGDPRVHPQSEGYWRTANPIGFRSCRDQSLRLTETLFTDRLKQHKVITKIVRIFYKHDPKIHHKDEKVTVDVIVQALRSQNVTKFCNWTQSKLFRYVADLAENLMAAISRSLKVSGTINLRGAGKIKNKVVAQQIISLANPKSRIIYKDILPNDPVRRKSHTEVPGNVLNWNANEDRAVRSSKPIPYVRLRRSNQR